MQDEQLNILAQIYNTLMLINTKGEDTLIMAECLRALQHVLGTQNGDQQPTDDEPVAVAVEEVPMDNN